MEIALLPKSAIRLKGKHASIIIDPQEKAVCNAVILLRRSQVDAKIQEESLIIKGPGDYEVGKIKIKGTRNEQEMLYSMNIDGVELLVGEIQILDKMQHKLKEYNIVLVHCGVILSSAFLTSLASNIVVFYGEKAAEVSQTFGKDNLKTMPKFASTLEKLPQELETILLS